MPRKPGQVLMNTHGLYKHSKDTKISTNETIHWSVRVLCGLGLRECPALRKYYTEFHDDTDVIWRLNSKQILPLAVQLREGEFREREKDLLKSWMASEGYAPKLGTVSGISANINASLGVSLEIAKGPGTMESNVYRTLSDILMPLLGETQVPTIRFPVEKWPQYELT